MKIQIEVKTVQKMGALGIVVCGVLSVAGCGRMGDLETPSAKPVSQTSVTVSSSYDQGDVVERKTRVVQPAPVKKQDGFFLDFLL